MKKYPLILLAWAGVFVLLYSGSAEEGRFVYQRSGRDPFLPWVTKEGKYVQWEGGFGSLEDVVLEGILWDPRGNSLAMMSGKILRRGERIGRFVIVAIGKEEVTLEAEGELFTLRLLVPESGEGEGTP